MLNDEQAAVFARLIAECAGAAYGNHGVDTTDAYRVLMAYIGDLLAAERVAVIEECAMAAENVSPRHTECGNKIAAAIRALKGK